ncbi:uncharacterized protein LOC130760087 isoform X2 [Actinidia eriantha]|uniref:uncharacterized protein LOC130760087 isoform X2 n=1 Tax=Actinidia eriantha TaxID=165200 RepID=UPI00258771E2|nr:uncharacterized protein LOC130760087 isoform X2 [Actinidia eriantha]
MDQKVEGLMDEQSSHCEPRETTSQQQHFMNDIEKLCKKLSEGQAINLQKNVDEYEELMIRHEQSDCLEQKSFPGATSDMGHEQTNRREGVVNNDQSIFLRNAIMDKKYGIDEHSLFRYLYVLQYMVDYNRCRDNKLCFLCENKKIEIYNVPCGCHIWCTDCQKIALDVKKDLAMDMDRCIICNAEVEKIERLPPSPNSNIYRQDMGVPQSTTEVEEVVVEKTLMTYSIIETKYGPNKQISLGKMREDYEECRAKNLCFLCADGKLEVHNVPCECLLWCTKCQELVLYMAHYNKVEFTPDVHRCILCNAIVEDLQTLP